MQESKECNRRGSPPPKKKKKYSHIKHLHEHVYIKKVPEGIYYIDLKQQYTVHIVLMSRLQCGEQHFIITLVLLLARGLAIGFSSTSVKTDKQYAYG